MASVMKKSRELLDFLKNSGVFTVYAKEILETFFEKEKSLIEIGYRSNQLQIRQQLIELLQEFAKHQEFSLATLHLGVYILDVYMDSYVLADLEDHQKLIALICLLLAAKSEDIDWAVPSIKDLLRIVDLTSDLKIDMRYKEEYDSKDVTRAYQDFAAMYCKLEFQVFESLNLNTIRPTVVSFMNIFQSLVVITDDVLDINAEDDLMELRSLGELRVTAHECLKHFLDIIIKEIKFFNILPSKLAAAVVGATRKILHFKSYWNESLKKLTRYRVEEIRPLMLMLIEERNSLLYDKPHYNDLFSKDSGFISVSSASETDEEPDKNIIKKRKLNRVGLTLEICP